MFSVGLSEVVLIAVVALVVLKPNDWPELLYKLGRIWRRVHLFIARWRHRVDEWMMAQELEELSQAAYQAMQKKEALLERTITDEKERSHG